jgi:subtilisin family serine protease
MGIFKKFQRNTSRKWQTFIVLSVSLMLISTTTYSYSASPKVDAANSQNNADTKSNNGVGQLDQNRGKSDESHGKNADNNGNGNGRDKGNRFNVKQSVALNLVLNTKPTKKVEAVLSKYGNITSVIEDINAVTIRIKYNQIPELLKSGIVVSYNEDAERAMDPPLENSEIGSTSFTDAFGTWNLDMMNVTEGTGESTTRSVSQTGNGSYVAVLDTGLLKNWRAYFDESSIATEYAIAFGGGGGDQGTVSTQPIKWERDQDSHGTHVTSTILGFNQPSRTVTGVAPDAKVIPVKVLGQNGSGWSSVISAGIVYVANLKKGPLSNSPVIINMSLGGPSLDAVEKAAIDYAIAHGVIVVASAGNSGERGMGYPGAYAPVISVAASGWTGQWNDVPAPGSWWRSLDVAENGTTDAYIASYSSREKAGQQLDVAAPGSLIVGPYQTNGQYSWYFLSGTSMASPHVAGLVALMMQKNKTMMQGTVESKLKSTATTFATSTRMIRNSPGGLLESISWGSDATGSGMVNAITALASVTAP